MTSFRRASLRCAVSFALALSFGLFNAEGLLADVHDGDAAHEELVRSDGAAAHATAHQSHGDAFAETGAAHAAPADHPGERSPGEPGHAQHSCHCAHVHVGSLTASVSSGDDPALHRDASFSARDRTPLSAERQRQFRPPIA